MSNQHGGDRKSSTQNGNLKSEPHGRIGEIIAKRGADGKYLSGQNGNLGEPKKTRDIIAEELGFTMQK